MEERNDRKAKNSEVCEEDGERKGGPKGLLVPDYMKRKGEWDAGTERGFHRGQVIVRTAIVVVVVGRIVAASEYEQTGSSLFAATRCSINFSGKACRSEGHQRRLFSALLNPQQYKPPPGPFAYLLIKPTLRDSIQRGYCLSRE
ncbi:hypothetical protein HZH68_001423 [Vespula germanica]|uniref:Uncharacterized protein n=1 Tax=Vespula germanica TaxID=30212 RepID=A0A834U6Z5_VESGE|nr:hypothetical protein HZH68_001423 [Vespula germanica]